MNIKKRNSTYLTSQSGMTLVELLVALAIGSFLMIGTIQVYNQSRQAFIINESIARVQETAQFAMDTIEADLRMASNWGLHSRGLADVSDCWAEARKFSVIKPDREDVLLRFLECSRLRTLSFMRRPRLLCILG